MAGRGTNDGMAGWTARAIHNWHGREAGGVLILGLAFKPDMPDLRNSKVADLVASFIALGHHVDVLDTLLSAGEAHHEHRLDLVAVPAEAGYDLVVLAVPHRELSRDIGRFTAALVDGGGIADLKNALGGERAIPSGVRLWTL